MRESIRTGISFGVTSGVITTLGLMVGLYAGTRSKAAVVGGILMIAVADAFSDAVGIHVHEESEREHTPREIWEATAATFVSKLVFALSFLIPVYAFELSTAVIVSVAYGLALLAALSYRIAAGHGTNPFHAVLEHIVIALIVIALTHFIGIEIAGTFHT